MLTEERHRLILEKLQADSLVYVTDLVEYLNASESTIRRDLNYLNDQGLLRKVHGGATLIHDTVINTKEEVVKLRKNLNLDDKMRIAKKAASLIEPNDVIYIDAGTTTEMIIDYIYEDSALYVTNGIVHARKLAQKGLRTIIIGGELKGVTEAVIGVEAVKSLGKYNFTKGFFGSNGVDILRGCTTPDLNEAMVKEEAVSRCKDSYMLCDPSKFNQISSITFAAINQVIIITTKLNDSLYNEKTKIVEVDV